MMNTACLRLEHRLFTRWPEAVSSLLRIGLATLGVLAAAAHADAAITLVGHVSTATTGGSGNDVATSAPINTTGANLCVASISEYTGGLGFAVPTDSASATAWTALTAHSQGASRVRVFYKLITSATSHTFASSGALGSYPSMDVACFGGINASTPFDAESAGGGVASGTSVQPGSVTPAANDSLVISALTYSISNSAAPVSVSAGTITDQAAFLAPRGVLSYQIQTSASATNPTLSWTLAGDGAATSAVFKSAVISSGLIETSKITCAGTFRIAVPQGSFTDFSHGLSAMTMKFDTSDNKRHYFALAGDGSVLESVEPTLSPCNTPAGSTALATNASWGYGGPNGSSYGSDWGPYPLVSTSGCPGNLVDYLPGECGQVRPSGLKWDSTNSYLLETWYPTYATPDSVARNSVAAATLNGGAHSLSLAGCWAANPTRRMQQVGGGVLIPPSSWLTANGLTASNGYWALGLGGPTGGTQVVSYGPSMHLVPAPSSPNACTNGTTTAYPTALGTILSSFEANSNGPTCAGSTLGCNTAGSPPTHPYPAQTAFTGYSSTTSEFWWDPYGGHGWFWGGTSFGMDWYDDGVVRGVLVPFKAVSGWATGTVLSSPAPSYNSSTSTGSFSTNSSIDTHDGYQPNVGDAMWVQTCVAGVDPDCDNANARDWTFVTIESKSGSGPYTFTYHAWGLDFGTGNHVPIVGGQWWFGDFYGHGDTAGTFPRAMLRLQVIDPNEYTKVLNGTYATSDLPTYHEDIDATSLFPQWGGPSTGSGVAQNYNGGNSLVGPSWAGADPDRQQFLVNVSLTDCPTYYFCGQIYVWNIGH
jgi:hypothetical protein